MPAPIRYKHLARYREIASVLVDEGLGYLIDELGLSRFLPGGKRARMRHAAEPRVSPEVRVRRALERLGPTFVKIGQILSTRPDVVPESYIAELRKLQDEVPPVTFELIRGVIESELDGPVEEIFASLDPVPLAAASIGQVHAAVLHSGEEVVVKVQRPDIRTRIDTDLDILVTQARFVERNSTWGAQMDVVAYAEELRGILHGELDYVLEGRNAERFAEDFADAGDVRFPTVHWDFTTQRVITLERFRGIKLDEIEALDAAGYDREELAARGVHTYLNMVFIDGFFHADPHPGNIFVLPDGAIGFTDFGRVGIISEVMNERLSDLFIALVDCDDGETLEALIAMGVASDSTDERIIRAELSRMFAQYYDVGIGQLKFGDVIRSVMHSIRVHRLRLPAEYALALATFIVLEGVGLQLDPKFNLVRTATPFARRIVRERLSPSSVARRFGRSVRGASRLLSELPDGVNRLVRRTNKGELEFGIRPLGLDDYMAELRDLVNRVAFSIIIGSFVVGLSLLLREFALPRWFMVLAGLALLSAAIVGIWLFMALFFTMLKAVRKSWRG